MTLRSMLVLSCLLLGAPAADAKAPDTVFLEELTSPELSALVHDGKTTILVPIGGTEQNGPMMALGKHNVRVKLLSQKIAAALGDALVAPVIAYVPEGGIDPPVAHMRFAGTITVPDEVFEKTLEYAARSFKLHGFTTIVFLGDHGGYQADEKRVADRLNKEWAKTPVRVQAMAEYYAASSSGYAETLRDRGFGAAEIGTHAGLADTSLMLAVDPALVRLDALRAGTPFGPEQGVYGDPRRASADLGLPGVEAIIARTVAAIRKAEQR